MLVFGHRGVKKTSPENTIEAIHDAIGQGADGVEIDIQLTRDGVPVVIHDPTLLRTHGKRVTISKVSFTELRELTAKQPVPSLGEVLDIFWKKTYFNIEVKTKNTGKAVVSLLASDYIKTEEDWKYCFISSFKVRELWQARHLSKNVQLALIHNRTPYTFFWYHRKLKFSAVGFHKHYTQLIATVVAKRIGLHTYVYTVNKAPTIRRLQKEGFDAVITDFPARAIKTLAKTKK